MRENMDTHSSRKHGHTQSNENMDTHSQKVLQRNLFLNVHYCEQVKITLLSIQALGLYVTSRTEYTARQEAVFVSSVFVDFLKSIYEVLQVGVFLPKR